MRPRFRQRFEGILSRRHQPEPAGAPTGHWQRHGRALVPVLRSKARSRPFLHPPQSGKEAVRIVCMDLSSTYRAMVRKHIPNARIAAAPAQRNLKLEQRTKLDRYLKACCERRMAL